MWFRFFAAWLAKGLIVVAILSMLAEFLVIWYDTAGPWTFLSGMRPLTDSLTGCQYLYVPEIGITPRLDVTGRQIGCRG